MKMRASVVSALLVFGSCGLAQAGKPPTAPANQANLIGFSETDANPPPAGVAAGQPSAGISQGAGSIAVWRGCYVVDPTTFTYDYAYLTLPAGDLSAQAPSAR